MVPSDGERLATIEQVLRDVRDDVLEIKEQRKDDHHRLRNVEAATSALVDESKRTQGERDFQLRKLGVKIQWLTLVVALGSFALGVAIALLAQL